MSPLLILLICLVLARGFGSAAQAIKLPPSIGEIGAGILLVWLAATYGESQPFLNDIVENHLIHVGASIAVFFIVLDAGIGIQPSKLMESSGKALVIACGGVIVPLIGGTILSWYLLEGSSQRDLQALLTGVVLSVTALPVVISILSELKMLKTAAGEVIVAAALFDDIITLFLLALLLAIVETGELPALSEFLYLFGKIAGFFALTIVIGVHIYPRVRDGLENLDAAAMEFSVLIMAALTYGWLAEILSLHWIIGTFMAGLFFEKSQVGIRNYVQLKATVTTIVSAVLAPLFFLSIGLYVNFEALFIVPGLFILLTLFAIASKFVGAGGMARILGFDTRSSSIIGMAMSARGVVALVILDIAYEAGVFSGETEQDLIGISLLSTLILVSIVSAVAAPLFLRLIISRQQGK
ncbi:MAG: cation:proton antiporter [Pseudomonas marincola]